MLAEDLADVPIQAARIDQNMEPDKRLSDLQNALTLSRTTGTKGNAG